MTEPGPPRAGPRRQAGSWAGARLYGFIPCRPVWARADTRRGGAILPSRASPRHYIRTCTQYRTTKPGRNLLESTPARRRARPTHGPTRFLPKIPSIGALKVPKTSRRRRSCLPAPPKLPALIWCFTVPFYGPYLRLYSSLVARCTQLVQLYLIKWRAVLSRPSPRGPHPRCPGSGGRARCNGS